MATILSVDFQGDGSTEGARARARPSVPIGEERTELTRAGQLVQSARLGKCLTTAEFRTSVLNCPDRLTSRPAAPLCFWRCGAGTRSSEAYDGGLGNRVA